MAASTSDAINILELKALDTAQNVAGNAVNQNESTVVVDKTISSMANLAKLLPTGTVLAFQALSPSFMNHGVCYISNKYLTGFLIYFCLVSCVFFSFTDSFIGQNGKLYYGIARCKGFYVFNYNEEDGSRDQVFPDLQKYKVKLLDCVHALFAALVFLTVAMSDSDIQSCFFPGAEANTRELLVNLPLGMGFLSSLIFVVFPTMQKGIGYTDQ